MDILFRDAISKDAAGIAALYAQAYASKGEDARNHYPFPQFLCDKWVVIAINKDEMCWVVAESQQQIIGAVGAVKNIGSSSDCVSEIFGLVIKEQFRNKGIASDLLKYLKDTLETHSHFILCEARTAIPAGCKVAKNCGFKPLGFEPYAHTTPAGSESMLLTGDISKYAVTHRLLNQFFSPNIHGLAKSVLNSFKLTVPTAILSKKKYPINPVSIEFLKQQFGSTVTKEIDVNLSVEDMKEDVYLKHDDCSGARFINELTDNEKHLSGVIGLNHLEGEDPTGKRYKRNYYVVRTRKIILGAILVVVDRTDRRARILRMRTSVEGLQGLLVLFAVAEMKQYEADGQFTLVINITSKALILQNTLKALGFMPTVYYPSLIALGESRIDGIQYTLLFNCQFEGSRSTVKEIKWAAAQVVISRINAE